MERRLPSSGEADLEARQLNAEELIAAVIPTAYGTQPRRQRVIHSSYNLLHTFVGGALIGLASLVALLASGTIPGISGIFSRLLGEPNADSGWRVLFLAGLIAGAALAFAIVDSA
jgi:hypothetical protein